MKINQNKIYILDAGTGTALQKRGIKTNLPLWSAKALFNSPQVVKDLHKEYILAGANIITTNTFRTQKRTLAKVGLENEVVRINELAVDLAKQAIIEAKAKRKIYIAASITTLEDCYEYEKVPKNKVLWEEHTEQINLFANMEIDLFLLETFNSIGEAEIAASIAANTNVPFIMSFVLNEDGNILSGEKIEEAIKIISKFNPIAFSVNCITPEVATKGLKKLKLCTKLPLGVFANGDGKAGSEFGWKFSESNQLNTYTTYCKKWKKMGVKIIGACCGTDPEYTKAYSKLA